MDEREEEEEEEEREREREIKKERKRACVIQVTLASFSVTLWTKLEKSVRYIFRYK